MRTTLRRSALALGLTATLVLTATAAGAALSTTTVNRDGNRIALVRSNTVTAGSPDGFRDIPGARVVMNVANGEVLLATFATSIACTGPDVGSFCNIRIFVTGPSFARELLPGSARFDSVEGPDDAFESHMAQWSSDPLPAGQYTIKAQYTAREKQDKPLAKATLNRWHMIVERLAA